MSSHWYRFFVIPILAIVLSACQAIAPPREFAPDGDLIKKAIALQLSQTERRLSEQLDASSPTVEINRIFVEKLDPLFIAKLPSYHLQGTYNLRLKLPRQEASQNNNHFDIYLQRQSEGKTWRLLRRETSSSERESRWTSYLIR